MKLQKEANVLTTSEAAEILGVTPRRVVALYMSTPGIWTLVVALLVLGVSASFAKPCQQALYLRQDASKQLGEDRAMGIYNFTENIGESLGPTVFGNLMAGPAGYVWAFLGSIGCAGAAHFALNRKRKG